MKTRFVGIVAGFLASALPAPLLSQNEEVDSLVRAEMQKNKVPGASVVVMRNGKVLYHGSYGVASIELNVPVTPATVFPLASITKTFAAAAVMLLVEQGKLSLDAGSPLSFRPPRRHGGPSR
ncbi:MAG: serine hydrolase domain-containing protein [Gemmatimonadaceae bacterium]